MPIYDSSYIYINSAKSLKEKIIKLEAVIAALYDVALKAAAQDDISEYWLDDGQTKIKTVYRGSDSVHKSIEAYEKLLNKYLNQLNGRTFQLRDGKAFRR